MKGQIASQFPSNEGEYSDLQVLQSGAGYYIGTLLTHNDTSQFPGMIEPGSRESEYFATKEEAEKAFEGQSWFQRMHP